MRKVFQYFFSTSLLTVLIIILASCEKEVSSTAPNPPIAMGKIVCASVPAGAGIFLNGYNTGQVTPDSIIHLEPGNYEVKFRYVPYIDINKPLELAEDEQTNVAVNFMEDDRNYGTLHCESEPSNALISINGVSTGKYTPDTIALLWPGLHEVQCSFLSHRDEIKQIHILAGQNHSASVFLKDTTISIDYSKSTSGMPGDIATCIAVDNENITWIGTSGCGLVKFDGQNWTTFDPSNSLLTTKKVQCITVDKYNKKWVGTPDGLYIVDGNDNWTSFRRTNSEIPNDFINDIKFDSKGNAWIGASDAVYKRYLLKYDGTEWTHYDAYGLITSLAIDASDNIWIGLNSGVRVFDGESWLLNLTADTPFEGHPIDDIDIDTQGRVWIGVSAQQGNPIGLYYFDGTGYNFFDMPLNYASRIHCSSNGNIWIGTQGAYVSLNPVSEISLIKISPSLNTTSYTAENLDLKGDYWFTGIDSDNQGNIWVSSRRKGASKIKGIN